PNNINVQGKLAASGGGPVTAGNYTFRFKIFDDSSAGTEIWPGAIGEDHIIAVGIDGLWNARLGKDFPLTVGHMDDTTRWLQVTVTPPVGSAETFPRVKLNSNPFTLEAGQLNGKTGAEYVEVAGDVMTGALSMDNDNNTTLEASLFGSGGEGALELYNSSGVLRSKLWVGGGGALNMYDASGDAQVSLFTDEGSAGARLILDKPDGSSGAQLVGGSAVNGSQLTMYGGSGLLNITLDGDIVGGGDGSVVFPDNAINSAEMKDEPGIASTYKNASSAMPTAATNYDTISINAPTSGFVVVNAYGFCDLIHVNGTFTLIRFTVSKSSGVMDFDNFSFHGQPSGAATGTYNTSFAITKVEAVTAGLQTYYLVGDEFSGNGSIGRPRMTAMFFPTNYGTVVSTKPVLSRAGGNVAASLDAAGTGQPSEVQVITVEESNARLEAERTKQMAELEARLKKLEKAVQQKGVDK
ncbi:MAG: hypothetical protein ACRECJ_05050, partial [Limisphaerales bacterium]